MKIWGRIHIDFEIGEPISKCELDKLKRAIDKIASKEFESSISDILQYYELPIKDCSVSLGNLGFDPDQENNEQN